MILYPHQSSIIQRNPRKIILAWATSLGKTLALQELVKKNKATPLIIVPKSIKYRWKSQMPNATVRSKEEFRKEWDNIPRHSAVIIDEHHHFVGKSQMTKSLLAYIKKHNPSFVWGATATIFRSSPWNAYYASQAMGLKWPYLKFRDTFFRPQYFGPRMVWVPKEDEKTKERLIKAFHLFCDIVSAEDANLAPEDVFEEELFELTTDQKKAIKNLKETESNPVVRYGKEHQISQGQLKGTEFSPLESLRNEKIPRIVEMAQVHPSMLIFARYNAQIEAIAEALHAEGHKVYTMTGATKDREALIERVQEEDECILICNAALGEGWETPRFTKILFASLPWGFAEYQQCLGRASRANVPKRRVYTTLTVEDSIDEDVRDSLEKKKDFNIELYARK